MSTPLKRYERAALRGLAIRALATACPHLKHGEIAAAIGVSRDLVRHYVQGRSKAPRLECVTHWQQPLLAASRALAEGHYEKAGRLFGSVAVQMQKVGPPEALVLSSESAA